MINVLAQLAAASTAELRGSDSVRGSSPPRSSNRLSPPRSSNRLSPPRSSSRRSPAQQQQETLAAAWHQHPTQQWRGRRRASVQPLPYTLPHAAGSAASACA